MGDEKEIFILGQKLKLKQAEGGFHTGLDSVMLAAACPAEEGAHILDLGCGVGGAGLAALYRIAGAQLTGIDVQQDHVDLANENASLNDMAGRAEFLCADVRDFQDQSFDHVICNPPYMEAGAHLKSPSDKRAKALGHDDTALEDWVKCAFDCLKGRGSLTMIHRADMVDKVVQAFGKRFGALEVIPLWPKAGEPSKRVIIRAAKHAKTPAVMHSGLVLHQDNGDYTAEANAVLRDVSSLFLARS